MTLMKRFHWHGSIDPRYPDLIRFNKSIPLLIPGDIWTVSESLIGFQTCLLDPEEQEWVRSQEFFYDYYEQDDALLAVLR